MVSGTGTCASLPRWQRSKAPETPSVMEIMLLFTLIYTDNISQLASSSNNQTKQFHFQSIAMVTILYNAMIHCHYLLAKNYNTKFFHKTHASTCVCVYIYIYI